MQTSQFSFEFWGVRGSIACPSKDFSHYGGNTSCVSVQIGDVWIVLDAGTGIRNLGIRLAKEKIYQFTLLMSHTHWDHVCGFPFFQPAYDKRFSFSVYCGRDPSWARPTIQDIMAGQMMNPLFPVPLGMMQSQISWKDFKVGTTLSFLKDIEIRTAPLNHPSGATAYRISHKGRSLCYVTDTEHVIGQPDQHVLDLINGADAVIYDTTYTDEEMLKRLGWGHSTWQEGVRLCQAANVKKLYLFHHDCDRDDKLLVAIENEARSVWQNVEAAREGKVVHLL